MLWSGGRGWLIDPAAHGGHRETDLAMLALFGAPDLDRILAGYHDTVPLAAGWRSRIPLHQLHPLLVHACLFGASYREEVRSAARAVAGRATSEPDTALGAVAHGCRRAPVRPSRARGRSIVSPRAAISVAVLSVVQRSASSPPAPRGPAGGSIRNVAPWPSAVRTEATPPWAATSAATIARPSPLPPVVRVLAWSAR